MKTFLNFLPNPETTVNNDLLEGVADTLVYILEQLEAHKYIPDEGEEDPHGYIISDDTMIALRKDEMEMIASFIKMYATFYEKRKIVMAQEDKRRQQYAESFGIEDCY